MDTIKQALGVLSDCIIFLVKEHEHSKTVFNLVRKRMTDLMDSLTKYANGRFSVAQTGSSFDELHLSRVLYKDEKGRPIIYPPIDFDFMMTFEEFKILDKSSLDPTTDLSVVREESNSFAVMLPGSYLGYVKLLVTRDGREMLQRPNCLVADDITPEGFLPNFVFKKKSQGDEDADSSLKYTISGPALSKMDNEEEGFTYDFVHAFPCETWPEAAVNWTKRYRPDGWPSKHLLQDIIEGGCAVVPVGHHLSKKEIQDLEWRISFNAAERKISKCLLPLQRGCYLLVKLIMKTTLSARCILTSYHVKNMMFWFCEQQHGKEEDWTVETQGERILQFIDYIVNALAHHSIPNYFIPPNNMISHRAKSDIDHTRQEVTQLKEKIVKTIFLVCIKLQIFDQAPLQVRNRNTDLQNLITIYVAFVKIMYELGIENLCMKDARYWEHYRLHSNDIELDLFSFQSLCCFTNVVALNKCFRPFINTGSPTYLAQSVPELLNPIAKQYMHGGELNKALASYQIMLETDKTAVESDFPDVYTNLGCLYANILELIKSKERKDHILGRAKYCFSQALKLIQDSPSLHFAYGRFLLDSKLSVISAIQQFEKAVHIDIPRTDDSVIIGLEVSEERLGEEERFHVSGKVAAMFSLCKCYNGLDDIYQARKIVKEMEKEVRQVSANKQKYVHFQLCAFSYRSCGLTEKAEIVRKDSEIYKKVNAAKVSCTNSVGQNVQNQTLEY